MADRLQEALERDLVYLDFVASYLRGDGQPDGPPRAQEGTFDALA